MKTTLKASLHMAGLALAVMSLTACPGKQSRKGAAAVPAPVCTVGSIGCVGQQGGTGALINLVSQGPNSSPILMQYSVLGDAAQINQISGSGMNPINAYTGPVTITGTMTVTAGTGYYSMIPMGMCGIPGGTFPFQATGQASGHGIFMINQLQVTAGVPMTFAARITVIHQGSAQSAGRAMMELYALSGPNQFAPSQVGQCGDSLGLILD